MAWIKTFGFRDPELTQDLAAAFMEVQQIAPREYLEGASDAPAIVKAHSLDPKALITAFRAGMHLLNGPSPLSRKDREMIATAVSTANRCFY